MRGGFLRRGGDSADAASGLQALHILVCLNPAPALALRRLRLVEVKQDRERLPQEAEGEPEDIVAQRREGRALRAGEITGGRDEGYLRHYGK